MHQILLREPWQSAWWWPSGASSHGSATDRRAAYQRQFNRPTGLVAAQPVLLTVSSSIPVDSAIFNELPLQLLPIGDSAYHARIDELFAPFNRLQLFFHPWPATIELPRLDTFAEVKLEIHDEASRISGDA